MASPRPASLARRVLPALALAGVSGAVLVQLDNPASSAQAGTAVGTTGAARSTGAAGTGTTGAAKSAGTTATTAPRSLTTPTTAGRLPAGTSPATRAPGAASASATPAATAPACAGTTENGPAVSTRFGPVQVAATFSADGSLCDVQALQWPNDRGRSIRINQVALPILRQEVLDAKSANIDIVSGATITSDAYATSLQSILDKRH